MPDESSAADEHALLQEITAPLARLPDNAITDVADPEFPIAFRGYDRLAVDAYVKKTSQLVAELQSTRSPEAAVRRALERVGEQIAGILKRAHETAEQITTQSRREAEDRLEMARQEAIQIAAAGEQRVKDLDADTDRIWAERLRIVEDVRDLASQLLSLADEAAAKFPPVEEAAGEAIVEPPPTEIFDAEGEEAQGAAAEQPPEAAVEDQPTGAETEAPPDETAVEEHAEEAESGPPTERAPAPGDGEPEASDETQQTRVMPPIHPQNTPPVGPAPEPAPPPDEPPD